MTTPAELTNYWREVLQTDPDGHGLIDRCSLWPKAKTEGGSAGDTFSYPSASRSNIPMMYEPAGRSFQYVVGGETHTASHRLFMIRSTEALAIKPSHRIKVAAREDNAEMTFQKPAILGNTHDPLVHVAAQLVIQGFA